MPLNYTPTRTVEHSFLHGMVTAVVPPYRTIAGDSDAAALGKAMYAIMGITEDVDAIYILLAECITYTLELKFSWLADAPEEIQRLEALWRMILQTYPVADYLKFFNANIPEYVIVGQDADTAEMRAEKLRRGIPPNEYVKGWLRAVRDGFIAWTPGVEWKMMQELTEEQRNDPLS